MSPLQQDLLPDAEQALGQEPILLHFPGSGPSTGLGSSWSKTGQTAESGYTRVKGPSLSGVLPITWGTVKCLRPGLTLSHNQDLWG